MEGDCDTYRHTCLRAELLRGNCGAAIDALHAALALDGENTFAQQLLSEALEVLDVDTSWMHTL